MKEEICKMKGVKFISFGDKTYCKLCHHLEENHNDNMYCRECNEEDD